jgi:class 3 adenylate cyclase
MRSLAAADRLLRVGETDLRGVGYLGFDAIALEVAGTGLSAPLLIERAGARHSIPLEMLRSRFPWYRVVPILAWVVVATLILVRSPQTRYARLLFATILSIAILETAFYGGPRWQSYTSLAIFHLSGGIAFILVLRWAIYTPSEVPESARLSPAWSWLGALWWVVRLPYLFGAPLPPSRIPQLTLVFDGLFLLGVLSIVTRNFLYSDAIGRRRIKWGLLSAYLGIAPLGLVVLVPVVFPGFAYFELLFEIGVMLFVLVPIGILIGVLKYNLYDVDRLLSVTASYSALGVALLATALTLLPRVAEAGSELLGIDASTGQTALSLLLAAMVVPAHRRLRPQVERLFFRERHAVEQGIEGLLLGLSGCTTPTQLTRLAGDRLDDLLRPESTTVYVRSAGGDLYEPAFVRGRAVPPAFEGASELVATLERRRGPLTAEAVLQGRRDLELSPFDRAALETLGVPVVLPIRRGRELVGFLCLGPKRSGDVYTSTDVVLLTAVSDKISSELLRFDQAQMLEAGRAMQESLRRYVPGAVAEQLEAGHDLHLGECEVTVLFVDLRRYTAYSEGRRPEEIFSTVNRYTDAVSRLVREQGGSVVEFNGDGMMTVFGAPLALSDKESRAVRAGREIVAAVDALSADEAGPDVPRLSVGIGIATGPAYVGNIRAVDRMIWSAIGNTTNLAARLQQLTRELDASIVVDGATWAASREVAAGWVRHRSTPIRGRSESVDLYGLPLRLAQAVVGATLRDRHPPPGSPGEAA